MNKTKRKFKILFCILDFTLIAFFIFALFIAFIYLFKQSTNNTSVPDVLGYTPFVVASGSMEPAIKINDVVIVKKVHYSELEEGDIIVYFNRVKDIAIIHRLISISSDGKVLTKGDASFTPDTPFYVTQIYGREICIIPQLGRLLMLFKNHNTVLWLSTGIIAVCFILINFKRK